MVLHHPPEKGQDTDREGLQVRWTRTRPLEELLCSPRGGTCALGTEPAPGQPLSSIQTILGLRGLGAGLASPCDRSPFSLLFVVVSGKWGNSSF